jgi:signal transduction histidine kinase
MDFYLLFALKQKSSFIRFKTKGKYLKLRFIILGLLCFLTSRSNSQIPALTAMDTLHTESQYLDSIIYQYRILGYDSSWHNVTGVHKELWSHLPAGTFEFEVRARLSNDTEWTQITMLELVIQPPFWDTWTFRIMAALVLCVLIVFFRRYEIRKKYLLRQVVEEKQKAVDLERSRISRDFHDGIGATLSQISISIDVANQKLAEGDATGSKEEINFVSKTLRNLMETLREIIWTLDPSHNKLEDLIVNIRFYSARLLQSKGLKLTFDTNVNGLDIQLTSEFRRNIFFIVKEVLNNICKHSKATNVDIKIMMKQGGFELEIHDNGIGFCFSDEAQDPRHGKGLQNIRLRSDILGGKVEINSQNGKGTSVIIYVPTLKKSEV